MAAATGYSAHIAHMADMMTAMSITTIMIIHTTITITNTPEAHATDS
jgi:hypothetical protein